MTDIYEQHDKAFKGVSAYVVTDTKGDRVATVAFKYAPSRLRTTCFFHILGSPMVKAFASGGGYDKESAAAHIAAHKVTLTGASPTLMNCVLTIREAIKDEGRHWDGDLRAAGFNVLQAV